MTDRIIVSAVEDDDGPAMPSWVTEGAMTYARSGVDIEEGSRAVDAIKGVVKETYRSEVIGDIGGFGGLFSISAAKDMDDPVLVSGTDGVGTKLQIARLADKHDTVGIDLVAMCANDILATGAEPLFFLDYVAIGKLDAGLVARIVSGIAEGCKQAGCALVGGEMAEHPGIMPDAEYDLSGFCVGIVDRTTMIGPDNVEEGDILLGLASSGLHSNGYSLVRKVCIEGKTHYEIRIEQDALGGRSLEDALLEPTRIYVSSVLGALKEVPGAVHALAHITGGGITHNVDRALPAHLDAEIAIGSWEVVPVAEYVCKAAKLDEAEALKTFNMGLGMVLAVDPKTAHAVKSSLERAGETVYEIGRTIPGVGEVVYTDKGSLFS